MFIFPNKSPIIHLVVLIVLYLTVVNKDCESNETVPRLISVLIKPGGNQGNKNFKETRISRKQEFQGNNNFKETII